MPWSLEQLYVTLWPKSYPRDNQCKHGTDVIPTHIFRRYVKGHKRFLRHFQVKKWKRLTVQKWPINNGLTPYSWRVRVIWLVIELDHVILPIHIFNNFCEYQITIQKRKRTKQTLPISTNSRTIVLNCLGRFGWLLNLHTKYTYRKFKQLWCNSHNKYISETNVCSPNVCWTHDSDIH